MTTLNPPQTPPHTPVQPPAQPPLPGPGGRAPRPGATVLSIVLVVIGAVIVVGTLFFAVLSAVASASVRSTSESVSASGLTALDVDVSAGRLTVDYADVDEATLDVTGNWGAADWTLDRDGDTLVVATPSMPFGLGWLFGRPGSGVLTLPSALEDREIDAVFELSAGDIEAAGTFGDLSISVSAGSLDVSGAARVVDSQVSAGGVRLELANVDEARFSVSAGETVARLTGEAPSFVEIDVSAGSLHATLPDETYDVRIDRSAGDVTNSLETSSGSSRQIVGTVSAGDVTLTPGR